MRNIAIIGAGQAGLLAAHALLKYGYKVTLFSDRTPQDFLTKTRPTGGAGRFHMALEFERELGLNHWEKEAAFVDYAHVTLCPEIGNRLMTLCGRLSKPGVGIDLRLQSYQWMLDLAKKGGKVVIENVGLGRLEEIAGSFDLTLVATGKGEMNKVFERDNTKSTHTRPQRKLAQVGVTGLKMGFDGAPGLPVKFNLFPKYGECFWMPWYHKDLHRNCWMLLVEAKEGGPLDKFDNMQSGAQVLENVLHLIKKMMPWDYAWVRDAQVADEHAWLAGSFTPEVRKPVGTLPSGKIVMPIGDTAIALDPIAGQGANCGNKMVRNLIECIINQEDRPFDASWMNQTFERFWQRHHWIVKFTDILLGEMTPAGKELFIAQYGSTGRANDNSVEQKLANAISDNFDDPARITKAFIDIKEAHKLIEQITGRSWFYSKLKGIAKIAKGQIRQKLGMDPHHPSTAPYATIKERMIRCGAFSI